jgi:putative ABC transport system substrate-binding protein
MRRIGVLVPGNPDEPDAQTRVAALQQGLSQLGWVEGRNVHIEYRYGSGNPQRIQQHAGEMTTLAPDLIFTYASVTLASLLQATRSIPIVFAGVVDPVGAGFVNSLSRPGGNATGFTLLEYDLSAKWLELLKQIAPDIARVAVLRDPGIASGAGQFAVIQSVAKSFNVEPVPINLRQASEIEHAIAAFAHEPRGGLIVTASTMSLIHRGLIVALAARHSLPAIYYRRVFVAGGGLIAYGADPVAQTRQATAYVDRILRGEKPADLPVQTPTKYEMAINVKTANTLGLTVPPALLTRADEVIE